MRKPRPFTEKDFAPVAMIAEGGAILAVRKGLPVDSVQSLVAYAKANPGKLTYGTTGTGGAMHLPFLLLSDLAGINMTHVPFRGSPEASTSLLRGDIDVTIVDPVGFAEQIKTGEIRALAYTSSIASRDFPDLPKLPDLVAGFDAPFWIGLLAPAGTPQAVIGKLNGGVNAAIESGALTERADQTGMRTPIMSPAEFARYIDQDTERWEKVIRANNLVIE
jgi:tripartite-type tricarboxylate transporter receptor subunit TctC